MTNVIGILETLENLVIFYRIVLNRCNYLIDKCVIICLIVHFLFSIICRRKRHNAL